MRKKYLSALLFGALLFASAGTFTSCKDYDDDINNLQEQINTINTSLGELTDKINALGAGVTDFKYENGKLVIVTDKGTNFEVTLPEAGGIQELEIKDGVLYADGEAVGPVAGEGGAVSVEVKDGVLYINGEAQELNDEVGSKVVIVDNGDGTYTLTADGTSCVLPKASASVSIALIGDATTTNNYYYFTNLSQNTAQADATVAKGGILWGKAEKYKGGWEGLKPVAKGQLLVGQIRTVDVEVSPATFDLNTVKLTLVNTLGETAPVTVTPIVEGKKGPGLSGSRAADENGNWSLQIAMTEDVTANNIGTEFASRNENGDYAYQNERYALAIDGKVATGYDIIVDTQEQANAGDFTTASFANVEYKYKKNGEWKDWNQTTAETLPLGETTLTIHSASGETAADKIYDAYIEIMDEDAAERYGITVSGMTITASDKAGALEKFPIKIHVLDVNGNEVVSDELNIKFETSTVAPVTFPDQTCVFMPTIATEGAFILVDMGDIFTSLTAEEADAVSGRTYDAVTWYTTVNTKTFATESTMEEGGLYAINEDAHVATGAASEIMYYASQEDALKDAMKGDKDLAIKVEKGKSKTIRTIKYAAIPMSAFKNNAYEGVSDIIIKMLDKDNNEVRKAMASVTVALPAFDDILDINKTQKLWNEAGDTYSTRFDWDDTNNGLKISMQKPFVSKKDVNETAYFDVNDADSKLYYELSYTDFDKKDQLVQVTNDDLTTLTGKIVKDGELMHEIEVEATLYPFGKANQENLKLTKTFKLYVQSVFEGAKLVYYVADAAQNVVTFGNDQYIEQGWYDGVKKNGLFVKFDGEERPYVFKKGSDSDDKNTQFNNGTWILDATLGKTSTVTPANDDVQPNIYLGEGASAISLSITANNPKSKDELTFSNVPGNTSGTVIFNFVDAMGVEIPISVAYKK